MIEGLLGTVGAPIVYKDHFPGGAELNQDFPDSLAKIHQVLHLIEHRHHNRYVDGAFGTCCLVFKKLRHYPPILRKGIKTEFFRRIQSQPLIAIVSVVNQKVVLLIELEQVLKIDLILWASALLELDHQSAIGHRYGYALHFSNLHLGLRFFVADTARLCHEIHGDLVIDSSNNPLLQILQHRVRGSPFQAGSGELRELCADSRETDRSRGRHLRSSEPGPDCSWPSRLSRYIWIQDD